MGLGQSLDLKRLARSAIAMLTATATLALGAVMTGTAMADPAKPRIDMSDAANGMYGGTVSADGKSWTGMTQPNLGATGLQLPFTAGADGDYYYDAVFNRVVYRYELVNPVNGKQRMARWGTGTGDPLVKTGKAWKLQWSFQPQAVTVTDPKRLEPGDTPVDKVTSSVGDLISGTGADGTTHNT